MRDTIRGIVGKLRKGVHGYILVAVDTKDYTIHSFMCESYGDMREYLYKDKEMRVIGWYKNPIKMTMLRSEIERKIGGIK